jgi:hypothetical protein
VEAGVIRSIALAIVVGLTATSCDDDPARSVKIIDRPVNAPEPAPRPADPASDVKPQAPAPPTPRPPAARPANRPARAPAAAGSIVKPHGAAEASPLAEWSPQSCPPPPEVAPGPGNLVVTGPCPFRHEAAVNCTATDDDFIIAVTRKAAGGATLVMYINVEKYHGPGRYAEAQMFLAVQEGTSIYRWSNDYFPIIVGEGEAFVELSATRLDGEPQLIDCSLQIGPATNYQYQCEGIADVTAIEHTAEVASGRLVCEASARDK